MRKSVVPSFVSLDGVIESPMTWPSHLFDEECKQYALRKLDNVEYFLLGRVTYETFSPCGRRSRVVHTSTALTG